MTKMTKMRLEVTRRLEDQNETKGKLEAKKRPEWCRMKWRAEESKIFELSKLIQRLQGDFRAISRRFQGDII